MKTFKFLTSKPTRTIILKIPNYMEATKIYFRENGGNVTYWRISLKIGVIGMPL